MWNFLTSFFNSRTNKEQEFLKIIKENSYTITKNTEVITAFKEAIAQDAVVRQQTLERIHDRIDKLTEIVIETHALLKAGG